MLLSSGMVMSSCVSFTSVTLPLVCTSSMAACGAVCLPAFYLRHISPLQTRAQQTVPWQGKAKGILRKFFSYPFPLFFFHRGILYISV